VPMTYTAGTEVSIRTRNGGTVIGTLLAAASLDYGSQYPVVRTPDGAIFNYRYAIVTLRNGAELSPIPGLVSMEAVR
jgi:hypothetical protein